MFVKMNGIFDFDNDTFEGDIIYPNGHIEKDVKHVYKKMYKVSDCHNDGTGDIFDDYFDTYAEAVDKAESDWCHFVRSEKKERTITVEQVAMVSVDDDPFTEIDYNFFPYDFPFADTPSDVLKTFSWDEEIKKQEEE